MLKVSLHGIMTLSHLRYFLLACAAVSWSVSTALAQGGANYTSIDATPDKPVQLSYHASAHAADCTAGALPAVRVTQAPKRGMLTVRKAILTTDKVAGCPPIKTPAQVVFYQARAGYTGPDHLDYEVTSVNGEVATYDVTITVKALPAPSAPAGDTNGRSL